MSNQWKIYNVQFAINYSHLTKDIVDLPSLFKNEFPNPTLLPLPSSAPKDTPRLILEDQNQENEENKKVIISEERIDIYYTFGINSKKKESEKVQNLKEFIDIFFKEIDINIKWVGIVFTTISINKNEMVKNLLNKEKYHFIEDGYTNDLNIKNEIRNFKININNKNQIGNKIIEIGSGVYDGTSPESIGNYLKLDINNKLEYNIIKNELYIFIDKCKAIHNQLIDQIEQ